MCNVYDDNEHHVQIFDSELDLCQKLSNFPTNAVALPSVEVCASLSEVMKKKFTPPIQSYSCLQNSHPKRWKAGAGMGHNSLIV